MTFSNSLQNHFLISMPNLKDHYFQKSITYIIQHDVDGAVGLVVNKPTPRKFDDVFTVENIKNNKKIFNLQDKQLLLGGPIYEENCFVLHDSSYQISASHKISTDIFLTTKFDIFDAIAQGSGPKDYLITLGCAGWSSGQLESELEANIWLTIPAKKKTLFEEPYEPKFDSIISGLNFNLSSYAPHVGRS